MLPKQSSYSPEAYRLMRRHSTKVVVGCRGDGRGDVFVFGIPLNWHKRFDQRLLEYIVDMPDGKNLQFIFDILRDLGEILHIVTGDEYGLDPAPQCRQQLFLQAANGQDAPAQRDLPGHRNIPAHRDSG